jgi:nitroreductase
MGQLDFIYNRRSVRKFSDEKVPLEDLHAIIKAATMAPSGKNLQTWHFVAVTDPAKIVKLAEIVAQKNIQVSTLYRNEERRNLFLNSVRNHIFFKDVPVLILVYAGPYPTIADELKEEGTISDEELFFLRQPNPAIQNAAAAMENLLLAAAALGYGTCWMTGLTYAGKEISEYIGFEKPGYHLAAATPLGIPARVSGTNPPRKPLMEVLTVIS